LTEYILKTYVRIHISM